MAAASIITLSTSPLCVGGPAVTFSSGETQKPMLEYGLGKVQNFWVLFLYFWFFFFFFCLFCFSRTMKPLSLYGTSSALKPDVPPSKLASWTL